MSHFDIFLNLLVALCLGGLLGLERTFAGKIAGMRTYALVSMGSALFVIISQTATILYFSIATADPLRMISQIIVGIGFIGAGLVWHKSSKVTGITTAAGLWIAAGVGIASGFGFFAIASIAVGLSLFVFTFMWYLEKKLKRFSYNGEIESENEEGVLNKNEN
ncbi:MAG: MgtC/SapB family protein [Minisyncoccia bacterium]